MIKVRYGALKQFVVWEMFGDVCIAGESAQELP
jgi:hypothetical protein